MKRPKRQQPARQHDPSPVDHNGKPLSPEHQLLLRVMRDETADIEDRMAAAIVLAPIMHMPKPVQYVSPAEVQRRLDKVLRR